MFRSFCPPSFSLLLLTAFAFAATLISPGFAQDNTSRNLIHSRHKFLHHGPHPTEAPTDKRFFTTRNSDVVLPLTKEDDSFVFAVFGDRTGGPADGVNVLADAVRDVNLIEPDLVMTVGDLINGYDQDPAWMTQMKEYKDIMQHLVCPWFPVAGNHDVYWRPTDDPNMPRDQHDKNFEVHFGPLWYSFQHKNCNFIVLYSDEGNPETGEKNFNKPECQKISDEQFGFLKQALQRGKDNDHQFVFLHHPRWLQGNYGKDWKQRVHPLLVQTKNVTAVFAGHIHQMRYDPADGIEYVTLASVGAHIQPVVPEAGFLHQYHLVTVRPEQVALTAYPVGAAMNVREITSDMQQEMVSLTKRPLQVSQRIKITDKGPQDAVLTAKITNPTSMPIEFTVSPTSRDSHWMLFPSHVHGRLKPGESQTVKLNVEYTTTKLDTSFRGIDLVLSQDCLAKTTRYSIPDISTEVEFDLQITAPTGQIANHALQLDGRDDAFEIPAAKAKLPQGPFTIEGWMNAASFGSRTAVFSKTQSSGYGIYVSKGVPSAVVHLNGEYVRVTSEQKLSTKKWHHLALVYNGKFVSLFVDGKERARGAVTPKAKRTTNDLPFFVGADPDQGGRPGSFFNGQLDEFRISKAAVYTRNFAPERRLSASGDTVLLYNFDSSLGPIVFDKGPQQSHVQLKYGGTLTELAP